MQSKWNISDFKQSYHWRNEPETHAKSSFAKKNYH